MTGRTIIMRDTLLVWGGRKWCSRCHHHNHHHSLPQHSHLKHMWGPRKKKRLKTEMTPKPERPVTIIYATPFCSKHEHRYTLALFISKSPWMYIIFPEQLILLGNYRTYKSTKRMDPFPHGSQKVPESFIQTITSTTLWGPQTEEKVLLKPVFLLKHITLANQLLMYWRPHKKKLVPGHLGGWVG